MSPFVIDTSAIIAVLNDEQDALIFKQALHEAPEVHASTATIFEAYCVAAGKRFVDGTARLHQLIELLALTVATFDERQLAIAREAYVRYGKGSHHRAGLNMGDCFAYALARSRNLPLLFKGDDFIHTDVQLALKPA